MEEEIELSPSQKKVIKLVNKGKNIAIISKSGTGKSEVLKKIISSSSMVYSTATTGIAALAIKGTTIHSFSGIGLCQGTPKDILNRVNKNFKAVERWKTCNILIIDEISMLDARVFDILEFIARSIRDNNKIFGGIQLILCGDFFQLPPVSNDNKPKFCFEAESWDKCIDDIIELTEVFRQSDKDFINVLGDIRRGIITQEGKDLISQCIDRDINTNDGIKPTHLYPLRREVDDINNHYLSQCEGNIYEYKADDLILDPEYKNAFNNCIIPSLINLKLGAQVMLIKNLNLNIGLCNGSVGIITRFQEDTLPVVKFTNEIEMTIHPEEWTINKKKLTKVKGKDVVSNLLVASRVQIPLILAWALTIHKSQGATLDRGIISLDNSFTAGMCYVALSRFKTLENLCIKGHIDWNKVKASPKVIEWYNNLKQ